MLNLVGKIALFALTVLPSGCALSPAGSAAAGHNWMQTLDGARPLSAFSIPGTHDSGALFEPLSGTAKCQNLTIAEQLDAGVRFLDIRCRHLDNAFTIHHGSVYQNDNFANVIGTAVAFLEANPSETIIMSVKEEYNALGNNRSFEATFDSYIAKNPARWWLAATIPSLDQARGKIVLFRRFGAASTPKGINASKWPDNATFAKGELRVQDVYRVGNNDDKWDAIESQLNAARDGAPGQLHVNFSSGTKSGWFGIPTIPAVADDINPRLAQFFATNPRGRFGCIVMDFADSARCAAIYETNIVSTEK